MAEIKYDEQRAFADGDIVVIFRKLQNGKIEIQIRDEVTKQNITEYLENEAEAQKLCEELADPSGDSMYETDSIVGKYPSLHPLRP